MLTIVIVARCDHCKGIKLVTQEAHPRIALYAGRFLPPGWVTAKQDGKILHFCSKQHRKDAT